MNLDIEVDFKCDVCSTVWKVSSKTIHNTTIDNVEINYIYCPECKEVYITKCHDKYIKNCLAKGKNKEIVQRAKLKKRSDKLIRKYKPLIKEMLIYLHEGL